MKLPDFLVIGAMKAGTTSFCRDLESLPGVFFPTVKEPHTLCLNEVLEPAGRRKYAALFRNAQPGDLCGEGSTGYSKLPTHRGVVDRAKRVLGEDLRLVYIVREPVARSISHHYHDYRSGDAPRDFIEAVRANPAIADISRYAMQLQPWLEAFGRSKLLVVRFEDYVGDRAATVTAAARFLGLESAELPGEREGVDNAGEETLLPPAGISKLVRRITRSQWYKRSVHPRTPRWMRNGFKKTLYRPAAQRPEPPSLTAVDFLLDKLDRDWERLPELLGGGEPFWDMHAARLRYAGISAQEAS